MSKEAPDHHDAELVLKVYDLRREAVLREMRELVLREFWPRSAQEAVAVLQPEHPLNRGYRQVSTYWEMVYGMARHRIVHAEYLVDNNGEGLLLFARVEPFLAAVREASSPRAFRNAEWIAGATETGQALMAIFRARVQKKLAAG